MTLRKSLAELPDQLLLEQAKALAGPRMDLLKSFLAELDREAYGALC
jgi:hypothetical protein